MLVLNRCHLADAYNVLAFRQPTGAFIDRRHPFFDVSHDDPFNHISLFSYLAPQSIWCDVVTSLLVLHPAFLEG
jgi:hypothetical protein